MAHSFDSRDLAGVSHHCINQSRKRIPFFRDLSNLEIRNRIGQAIRCADSLGLIFDNHKRKGQFLAYAQFHDRDFWFVLGPNQTENPGDWLVVTIFVHKDKNDFSEYYRRVEETLREGIDSAA